jgi:ElaB/YqjD/DUF883 family membrane-anchored ribosome-binding protein
MSYLQHSYSFSNKAWSVVAQEHRGVLPFDSAGRIQKWYLTRLESILLSGSEFKDIHPANHTVEQYRAAIEKLESVLAEERQKAETEAEAARLKAIDDALEAARWSNRIKRAAKRIVNALRRFVAVVTSQRW